MKSEKNNRTIRLAGTADRATLYQLWQNCFHDPEAFADYYFDYWFKENKVLMLEEQSELKAMLHLNPYKIAFNGLLLDSYYIVGVATAENYRHRKAMTQLLREAFVLAYDTGMPFVYLMPADEAIYRPFQFAYIYAQQVEKKIISPQKEQSFVEAASMDISFRSAAAEEDWQDAADMVNSYMERRYDLFTWRSAHYFERLQLENRADGGDLLMLYGGDERIGYLSYAREAAVEVREIYCKPEWRRQAADWLMTFLKMQKERF